MTHTNTTTQPASAHRDATAPNAPTGPHALADDTTPAPAPPDAPAPDEVPTIPADALTTARWWAVPARYEDPRDPVRWVRRARIDFGGTYAEIVQDSFDVLPVINYAPQLWDAAPEELEGLALDLPHVLAVLARIREDAPTRCERTRTRTRVARLETSAGAELVRICTAPRVLVDGRPAVGVEVRAKSGACRLIAPPELLDALAAELTRVADAHRPTAAPSTATDTTTQPASAHRPATAPATPPTSPHALAGGAAQ